MDLRRDIAGYAWAVAATAACTAIGLAMAPRFDPVNIAMVYLVAVVVIALRHSRGPAVAAALLGVLAFDVVFVPPQGRLTVDDLQYLFTFAVMLAVALIISRLTEATRAASNEQAALEVRAETERIRSTLLASISHDLRTPLAVMAGASSTLAERGEAMDPGQRRELAQSIVGQARDMTEHVNKVLQMTRLEAGAVEVTRDWASLPEIAASVLARLADRLRDHRVVMNLPGTLPLVRVDAALIEQVLANLLENAARHTPAGTAIQLRATVRDAEVVTIVEDYGGSLPPDRLEAVFEKFSHGTTGGAGGGMGLGLAICRAIVRLHGGRTWAENVGEGGTAFCFSLPLEAAPTAPAEAPGP